MWEIDVAEQTVSFFVSLAIGSVFCVVYDLFRAVRRAFAFKNVGVFLSDVLFFVICAFVTFCFLLSLTQGFIRGYFIFGIVVGFLIVFFSVSKFVFAFFSFLLKWFITAKKALKNFVRQKIGKIKKFFKNKRQKTIKKA